jgi:hypothetical protein
MRKEVFKYLFLILILSDLAYSFSQHYNQTLDGDMAGGIVPADDVRDVLNDPFGISVITQGKHYPNPNRFFAHWLYKNYFTYTPVFFQEFMNPIESVYFSSAVIKTIIQISIILLLAKFISGSSSFWDFNFLLSAVLICPLFQSNGWQATMGIIDSSITYTFFYSLPMILFFLFYLPLFNLFFRNQNTKDTWMVFLIGLVIGVIISFSSPLIPGIVLIISLLIFVYFLFFLKWNEMCVLVYSKKKLFILIGVTSLLCMYALYIGKNNSIFYNNFIPISERYARLPEGLFRILTTKIGWPILILFVLANIFLIYKLKSISNRAKYLRFYAWIFIFSIVYILLLPLGGYKVYRPLIIRFDTFIPVTLSIFYIFASSSLILIHHCQGLKKKIYVVFLVLFLGIFTITDKPDFSENDCEKQALTTISMAKSSNVYLPCNCTVLSWEKVSHYESSILVGKLLYQWNITNDLKTFSQIK